LLIKSENFQGLQTIMDKYKEEVQTIYIDPPFNTEKKDFPYKDNYKTSSWTCLIENRLIVAKHLLDQS